MAAANHGPTRGGTSVGAKDGQPEEVCRSRVPHPMSLSATMIAEPRGCNRVGGNHGRIRKLAL